jgi:N-acetyl-gamma-glutamyl-phosphate reductase
MAPSRRARRRSTAGITVIDLSADFRPRGSRWAGRHAGVHPAPELIDEALYGLTEWVDWAPLVGAQRPWLVANPGCYATAILLAALPAAQAGWWSGAPLVVNALSGVSGAGRGQPDHSFRGVRRRGLALPGGETHQHRAEIAALLGTRAGTTGALVFNPHLVPMARAASRPTWPSAFARGDAGRGRALYAAATAEPLPAPPADGRRRAAQTRHVKGSNRAIWPLRVVAEGRMLVVFSAIDNLVKGAAGQAVQNMNRLMGWPEDAGLPREAWPCV